MMSEGGALRLIHICHCQAAFFHSATGVYDLQQLLQTWHYVCKITEKGVFLQSAKRKALAGDPDSFSDLELWQQIVRCLHAARKKLGEQRCIICCRCERQCFMWSAGCVMPGMMHGAVRQIFSLSFTMA